MFHQLIAIIFLKEYLRYCSAFLVKIMGLLELSYTIFCVACFLIIANCQQGDEKTCLANQIFNGLWRVTRHLF